MYFYVFDNFLQDDKYRTEILRMETRLAALGIQGRTEKITILKNIHEATEEAIKRGATTVVTVGNDKTITKLLPIILEHKVTLGIIPVGPGQRVAEYLGIPAGIAACDSLSRRVIEKLDVGKVDSHFFLLEATLPPAAAITCDGKYTVASLEPEASMTITNLGPTSEHGSPSDGRLELIVAGSKSGGGWSPFRKGSSKNSVFPIRKATVARSSDGQPIVLDGETVVKTPVEIEVLPKHLSVIVGRQRKF